MSRPLPTVTASRPRLAIITDSRSFWFESRPPWVVSTPQRHYMKSFLAGFARNRSNVEVTHLAADVRQERHAQAVFLHKRTVVGIAANADHLRSQLLKLGEVGLEGLRFFRAARGAVLWVEEHLFQLERQREYPPTIRNSGGWGTVVFFTRLHGNVRCAPNRYRQRGKIAKGALWVERVAGA